MAQQLQMCENFSLFFPGENFARSHLASVDSSCQESTAEHPGGDLLSYDLLAHCVIDDFHCCFLQQHWQHSCKSDKRGVSDSGHVSLMFMANIKGVNGLD